MKKLALIAALALAGTSVEAANVGGAYVGVGLGGASLQNQNRANEDYSKHVFASQRGAAGTVLAGYDWAYGQFLIGAELGAGYSTQKMAKEHFLVRGKIGYALDNVSVGLTAGIKNARFKTVESKAQIFDLKDGKKKERFNAFELGGFISTMVTDNIELGAHYAHDFFKKKRNNKLSQDTVQLRVAYKM